MLRLGSLPSFVDHGCEELEAAIRALRGEWLLPALRASA